MKEHSYQDKLRAQVRQWQDRIDRLRANVRQAGTDSRRQFEEQIEDLQAKQKAATRKLAELERSGGSPGRASRGRIRAAKSRMQHAIRRLVSGFR